MSAKNSSSLFGLPLPQNNAITNVSLLLIIPRIVHISLSLLLNESKYSRVDEVKFVEDRLYKI